MITVPDLLVGAERQRLPEGRPSTTMKGVLPLTAVTFSLVVVGAVLFLLLRPAADTFRQRAKQTQCQRKMQRLARAIQAYRDDHGRFPPAYTVDADQKPLHSWRVLVLPYLGPEEQSIYSQLKLDEPWDSQHNRRFAQVAPLPYACPEDQPFASGDTSYCAVAGPRYSFRQRRGIDVNEITDDLATTLLLVEVHDSGINWMQPRDITAAELMLGLNSGIRGSCGSRHRGGATTIATADGRVHALSDATPPDQLHRMATIDGGEAIRPLSTTP